MRRYGIPFKSGPSRGSHLPVLMKLVAMTTGPILELGGGMYSTPYLHWTCYPTQRPLVTYENDEGLMPFLRQFTDARENRAFHQVRYVQSYDDADLSGKWSIVLVDHSPHDRRIVDIARVQDAEYIVAHDADNVTRRLYRYDKIRHLFKYRWKYNGAFPKTAVYSNHHSLEGFSV